LNKKNKPKSIVVESPFSDEKFQSFKALVQKKDRKLYFRH